MSRLLPFLSVALLATVGAGCGSGSGSSSGSSTAGSTTAVASATKARVGRVLVDARGRTLYRFTAERQGTIVCSGPCTTTWPPALAPAGGPLGSGVTTLRRPDGRVQLTYRGTPLYRYAGDRTTADATGDGVGGTWFAVKATGASPGTTSSPPRSGY
jgi:predicted lipoprotein with Yx(FWY)xxD motif